MATKEPMEAQVVIVDWKDLVATDEHESPSFSSPDLANALEAAYGSTGTGILAIRNVPDFLEAKNAFLPMAHNLISLPKEYLENELTDPDSLYNAGWSHGKEKLRADQPDFAKGSFYFNPITDLPGTPQDRQDYPLSYPANKWPDQTRIPNFRPAAQRLGQILKDAVVALSHHVDALAQAKIGKGESSSSSYPTNFLYDTMKDTDKVKGRLLYYFPLAESSKSDDTEVAEDSWIGWHNDSGFFTALAGDLYVDHTTGRLVECPDPSAGLYVVDRQDRLLRVTIPSDCLAIQMGECTQIVTGGTVTATPHCVRGVSNNPSVARISLACFVDTPPTFPLAVPKSSTVQDVLEKSSTTNRVPPLKNRWTRDGMSFGDFLRETFQTYYEWANRTKTELASINVQDKEGEEKLEGLMES